MTDEKNNAMNLTVNVVGKLTAIQDIYIGIMLKYEEGSEEKAMIEKELKHVDEIMTTMVRLYNEKYAKQ